MAKTHHNYILKFIDTYGVTEFNNFYSIFDETHYTVRKNSFELTLSQILWKLSNQHGDGKTTYNLDVYPKIYIPLEYYDLIFDALEKQTKDDLDKCSRYLTNVKKVYYEDVLHLTSTHKKSPDKHKYILNYDELKSKRGNKIFQV